MIQPTRLHPEQQIPSEQIPESTYAVQSSIQQVHNLYGTRPSSWCQGISVAAAEGEEQKRDGRGEGRRRGGGAGEDDSLRRLVSHTATFGGILAAAQNVTDQCVPAEKVLALGLLLALLMALLPTCSCSVLRATQTGLDQWPATTDPVTVAPVDQLVCTTRESAFWGILAGR